MECECLFCYEKAYARITVPTVAPRTAMCKDHVSEFLQRSERHRRTIGMVQIEPVE